MAISQREIELPRYFDEDQTRYLFTDALGSVTSVKSVKGGNEKIRYDAWGGFLEKYERTGYIEEYSKRGVLLGYNGKPYDSFTELYNYGYRHLSTDSKQWLTQDPIRDGSNWHAYLGGVGDPVNYVDMWGLHSWVAKTGTASEIASKEVELLSDSSNKARDNFKANFDNSKEKVFIPIVNENNVIVGRFSFTEGWTVSGSSKYDTGNYFIVKKNGDKYEKVKISIDEHVNDNSRGTRGRYLNETDFNGNITKYYYHIMGERIAAQFKRRYTIDIPEPIADQQYVYLSVDEKLNTVVGRNEQGDYEYSGEDWDYHTYKTPIGRDLSKIIGNSVTTQNNTCAGQSK